MIDAAELYDAMCHADGKDYAGETAHVLEHIDLRCPDAATLLDVACGTGGHLEHLRSRFVCEGVDLDADRLRLAAARCPGVPLVEADMRSFDLGRTFDVVTCLFSSIGYLRSDDDLSAGVAAMAQHLAPGGLLVVEPWFAREAWFEGRVQVLTADLPGGAVATRVAHSGIRGDLAVLDFQFLIADEQGITHHGEMIALALRPSTAYIAAFEAAGLVEVEVDPVGPIGRGLLLGTCPA